MRLRTTSLALLALLVSVSVSLPHGAEAAPKVTRLVPPAVGQQHQHGQPGGGPTAGGAESLRQRAMAHDPR